MHIKFILQTRNLPQINALTSWISSPGTDGVDLIDLSS